MAITGKPQKYSDADHEAEQKEIRSQRIASAGGIWFVLQAGENGRTDVTPQSFPGAVENPTRSFVVLALEKMRRFQAA
jgi:hypothetical protein